MLHRKLTRSFHQSPRNHPDPSTQNLPQIPLNQHSSELDLRQICNLLVTLTKSRSVPKGLQLHAHIIKSGLHNLPVVSNYLLNFYSKAQLPLLSRQIFEEAPHKSSTTWSSIISSFSQNELPLLALEFFRRMLDHGVRPDDRILPSAIRACGISGRSDFGRSLHGIALRTGISSDMYVGSSMVDMYSKCGDIVDARKVFDEMPEKNVVSWTGLICGYAQLVKDEEALRLFKQAVVENMGVNDFTFSCVISVCGNSTLLELGKQIHGLCLKMSFDTSSFVSTSLVSFYSKCGAIEGAYRVFDEVPFRDLGMCNAMLIACAQYAHTSKAFDLFRWMESFGPKPNFITFLCVLNACSHAGLVKEGQWFFDLMKKYRIVPGAQHYASMVDLLGRAGKLQEAMSIIKEMPVQPTESVWGALLTGCRIHGDTELAAFVADRMFELDHVNSGLHVLLSNAYAAAGRWEEAAKVRKRMRDRGLKKETGLSWVEEGNRVHVFSVGDRSHAKCKEIYSKLEELGEEIEKAGYVANTSFVLQVVDDDEKNQAIRYHSERIAIAFALLTFPLGRPIRVMKNLRVCGDCHNAIKFISKCSGRTIIVRDNNRFHRFEGGKCSCGDYW